MASISYLLAVLLLLLPSYGLCATLKVCPSGCTYVTISSAVSAASANDVISVSPGDYTESNQVTIAKNLTIACASGACVVDAPNGWLSISAVLTLNGSFAVSSTKTSTAYGVTTLSSGGIWNQNGDITITATTTNSYAMGVYFDGGGIWNQNGKANITAIVIYGAAIGVAFNGGGTWNQKNGAANIMVKASGGFHGYGMYFVGNKVNQATWNQYGNVMMSATTYAVYFLRCGTWNKYGTTNILPDDIYNATKTGCALINEEEASNQLIANIFSLLSLVLMLER